MNYTKLCIESIIKYTKAESYEIIVVDNGSADGTREWLREQNVIKINNSSNQGFTKACNQGIKISSGDNILLLNNDVIVTKNWLSNLLTALYSSSDIGAVGPLTNLCSNNQAIAIKYSSIEEMERFAENLNKSNSTLWQEKERLIGFCFLFKRQLIEEIGYLDEIFSPGNYEDDDYSLRIRLAGYRLLLCRDTFIHHFGSVSFKEDNEKLIKLREINKKKFEIKWKCRFEDAFSE